MANEAKRYMTKPRMIEWLKGSLDSPDIHGDIGFLVRTLEGKTDVTAQEIDILLHREKEEE